MMTGPAKTQMTLLERGHKSCDHVRGRHFLVLCSRGPTAMSASIISPFGLRLGLNLQRPQGHVPAISQSLRPVGVLALVANAALWR